MKRLFLILLLIPIVGCAHIGTVKPHLNNAEFQAENLPYRTLPVCVISEGSWPRESILAAISDASRLMAEQVGIQLKIENWIDRPIPSYTQAEGLKSVVRIVGRSHKEYALVIGFSSRSAASYLVEVAFGTWLGAIDDNYRKFIVIKHLDERVLMHEIGHAFVFTKSHSSSGVMSGTLFKIPLVPVLFNIPRYLSAEDRREILRNKWRDFNEKPEIPEEFQVDTVELPPDASSRVH